MMQIFVLFVLYIRLINRVCQTIRNFCPFLLANYIQCALLKLQRIIDVCLIQVQIDIGQCLQSF